MAEDFYAQMTPTEQAEYDRQMSGLDYAANKVYGPNTPGHPETNQGRSVAIPQNVAAAAGRNAYLFNIAQYQYLLRTNPEAAGPYMKQTAPVLFENLVKANANLDPNAPPQENSFVKFNASIDPTQFDPHTVGGHTMQLLAAGDTAGAREFLKTNAPEFLSQVDGEDGADLGFDAPGYERTWHRDISQPESADERVEGKLANMLLAKTQPDVWAARPMTLERSQYNLTHPNGGDAINRAMDALLTGGASELVRGAGNVVGADLSNPITNPSTLAQPFGEAVAQETGFDLGMPVQPIAGPGGVTSPTGGSPLFDAGATATATQALTGGGLPGGGVTPFNPELNRSDFEVQRINEPWVDPAFAAAAGDWAGRASAFQGAEAPTISTGDPATIEAFRASLEAQRGTAVSYADAAAQWQQMALEYRGDVAPTISSGDPASVAAFNKSLQLQNTLGKRLTASAQQQQAFAREMGGDLQMYRDAALGRVPSVAELQMQEGLTQAQRQALSMAATARDPGAYYRAQRAQGNLANAAINQSAQLRAQEMAAGRAGLTSQYQTQAGALQQATAGFQAAAGAQQAITQDQVNRLAQQIGVSQAQAQAILQNQAQNNQQRLGLIGAANTGMQGASAAQQAITQDQINRLAQETGVSTAQAQAILQNNQQNNQQTVNLMNAATQGQQALTEAKAGEASENQAVSQAGQNYATTQGQLGLGKYQADTAAQAQMAAAQLQSNTMRDAATWGAIGTGLAKGLDLLGNSK